MTKNGYPKLIELIEKYPSKEILAHTDEIALDRTQALKMLSGNERAETVPGVWDRAKQQSSAERRALLLVSVIFSHETLIKVFQNSTDLTGKGVIKRENLEAKTYTNLAFALNEFGVAIDFETGASGVRYDLGPLVHDMQIGPLSKELIEQQLKSMGWRPPTSEEPFTRDFYEQSERYGFNKVFGLTMSAYRAWLEGQTLVSIVGIAGSPTELPFAEFFTAFAQSLTAAALKVPPFLQKRFVGALLTKPFVILTGLAGSGKTKLAQAFAHWVVEDVSQVCMVAVGADWTNREPLLGYPNALSPGTYVKPDNGVLDTILEAAKGKNAHKPYFLILDEMNLSHIERYFADFLSAIESGEVISLHPQSEDWKDDVPAAVTLPPNLFVIGTVNIDETTYMFSPKVLDRASVIEFRVTSEDMEAFLENPAPLDLSRLKYQGARFAPAFAHAAAGRSLAPTDLAETSAVLLDFFDRLKTAGAEFGYRTAAEIHRFIGIAGQFPGEEGRTLPLDVLLDAVILQKLLPKVHGSRRKIEPVLDALRALCADRFPLSLEKIDRMKARAIQEGFTSYAEA